MQVSDGNENDNEQNRNGGKRNRVGAPTKRDRFLESAALRTDEVLRRIKILGNCSNRSLYEYTEPEVKKIFSAIDREIKITKAKFMRNRRKTERFTL